MAKVLRVCMEAGRENNTIYLRLVGDEPQEDVDALAESAFFDWANYSAIVIDEAEVPAGGEIQG